MRVLVVFPSVLLLLAACNRSSPTHTHPVGSSVPDSQSSPQPPHSAKGNPGSSSDPSARGAIPPVCLQTNESLVWVDVDRQTIRIGGVGFASTKHPSFLAGAHNAPALPSLRSCLAALSAVGIVVRAKSDVAVQQLIDVLRDAQATGSKRWELRLPGGFSGTFSFLTDTHQCSVEDMYFGPSTAARISWGDFVRTGAPTCDKIRFVVDFGKDLGKLAEGLGKANGKKLEIQLHTGPF